MHYQRPYWDHPGRLLYYVRTYYYFAYTWKYRAMQPFLDRFRPMLLAKTLPPPPPHLWGDSITTIVLLLFARFNLLTSTRLTTLAGHSSPRDSHPPSTPTVSLSRAHPLRTHFLQWARLLNAYSCSEYTAHLYAFLTKNNAPPVDGS